MKKLTSAVFFLVLAAVLLTGGLIFSASSAAPTQDEPAVAQRKISQWLLDQTANGETAECLVILRERAELSGADRLQAKEQKGRYVRDTLLDKAQQSQQALLEWLRVSKLEHRAYYIVNAIWVKADRTVIEQLAARRDVERLDANPRIKQQFEPQLDETELRAAIAAVQRAQAAPAAIEPGVTFIRAPEVWATGFTGQGIVVGGADTGVNWNHTALRNQYRGWNGTAANHNFNWHDSIHNSAGNPCGNDAPAPCDDDSHGTHTVGTAVGSDGGSNQIGVAPGAKWIGCRNMDEGNGTPATYIECMEWFLAPYPIGGTPQQGDPTKAPDITTNSWSCPPSEGCQPATLQQAVEAQRAAGILMVVAAGNSGSACSTVSDPPSFYAASYTVGAISSSTGNIASFSSRGPATIDGSNRLKPEITAPGLSVRSSVSSGGYGTSSGTSMATPHVAGAIALLWSARPNLRHQIQQTIELVNQAAVDVSVTACSSSGVPNNVYGWGRLDIKAAVDAAGGGGCVYSINPASQNFPAAGGSNMVTVTTTTGCAWMAMSNAGWINITSGSSGSGSGAVNHTVAANAGPQRTGTLTIAGQTFTVTQSSGCPTITINPSSLPNGTLSAAYSQSLTAAGGAAPHTFSLDAGSSLPPGVTLTSGGLLSGTPGAAGTFNFTVRATDINNCSGTRAYSLIINSVGLAFYPLPHPIRLLDTRTGQTGCDAPNAPISGGTARIQTSAGRNCEGIMIPSNARAITGNITTVQSGGGYLTLYPSDAAQPTVANSNYLPNEILNNAFTVGLGNTDGAFKIYVTSTTHAVVDVTGYYAPPGAANPGGLFFHPLPKPIRLLETRVGLTGCNTPNTALPGNADSTQPARLTCAGVSIPPTAQAIVGNATTVNPQGTGFLYLTLFPADAARPLVASSNYLPGQTMNAPFTVGLSPGGEFKIFPTSTTDLVIDVLGYYSPEATDQNGAGLLFNPLPRPVRLLETRSNPNFPGCYKPNQPIIGSSEQTQPARGACDGMLIANTALAIMGNATVVNSNGGFLTFWPSDAAQPVAAVTNFNPGQVFNRHFTVGLGQTDGAFKLFSQLTTDLVIDVSGYFAP